MKVTGGFERPRYKVENILFESMPGFYVTGNLYLPKTSGKSPAIFYVSGHSPGPNGAKVDYQRHGIWFAQNGFAAFLLDRSSSEKFPVFTTGRITSRCGTGSRWAIRRRPRKSGTRFARSIIWRHGRRSMPPDRNDGPIRRRCDHVVHCSGDDRIKAAAPVHGTWTIGPHVSGDTVRENCDCIYFWNPWQLDLPALAR